MSGHPGSNRPCATTTSTRSVSLDFMFLTKLNLVEPPWYVTRMPGGVRGGDREEPPYSIGGCRIKEVRRKADDDLITPHLMRLRRMRFNQLASEGVVCRISRLLSAWGFYPARLSQGGLPP